jgi:hypothetical protein
MRIVLKVCGLGAILSLLLLCACATNNSVRPSLPADVAMNKTAGCGEQLFLKLHLKNGKDLRFVVDTGSPWTILDKSLEPELGKKRIGKRWLRYAWFQHAFGSKYKSPELYLGNTPLILGDSIATDDLKRRLKAENFDGILGMDCLRHYCIQLDFAARKIRFLDPDNLQVGSLGKPFPLDYIWWDLSARMNFSGKDAWFRPDTGDYSDGTLESAVLERLQKTQPSAKVVEDKTVSGETMRQFYIPGLTLGGNTYTNLWFNKTSHGPNNNILGLRFIARHLVTLNFPKRTMYLKQTSVGPLVDEELLAATTFAKNVVESGQLPGISKGDKGKLTVYLTSTPVLIIFSFQKVGDTTTRYYLISRMPDGSAWKLQKTWEADQNGNAIKEYSNP